MSKIPGVWLFLGPEEGNKQVQIAKLVAETAARTGSPPEIFRRYAFESCMEEVLLCLQNKSLFAAHRIVILGALEEMKKKEEIAACISYIRNPVPDATLILVSGEPPSGVDRKIVEAVPKTNQTIFWELFDNQKKGWIVSFFRQKKVDVDPQAVDEILDLVENNTRDLKEECERLASFIGPGTVLSAQDITKLLDHNKDENVFSLFEHVCRRDLESSVDVLDRILLSKESDAIQLQSGLLYQFRKLSSCMRLLSDNFDPAEAFQRERITSKKSQKTYTEGSRNFNRTEVDQILLLLADFDVRFRMFKSDLHGFLLRLLLYYIVAQGGRGAWKQSLSG
jgi:DNA polymerase III subunit delta